MSKNISFMRKNYYSIDTMNTAIEYLTIVLNEDNHLFKQMINKKEIYLDGKRFTYIIHKEANKKYRIMGNCIGLEIYIRDILNIDDSDDLYLDK